MKDSGREDPVSRHEVFEDYVNFFFQQCPEVGPCRDPPLLRRVARYLQTGEPGETFPLLPVHRVVLQGCDAPGFDCRKHLFAVSKAAELLETLCVNLFLQPWKKEIRTLKTYTGPFVYHLLPVLSSSTIQSVLASIGYLPHTDTALSEYRLSEEADPQRAQLLGFQLLLARVECSNLLELLERLGPQEWLDVLQRKAGPKTLEENTTKGQRKEEEEEIKKEEEADRREDPQSLDSRPEFKPQPKPRRSHLTSVDQSILEMHKSYPDLSIKGRRLVPHRAPREDSRGREGRPGSTDTHCDEAGADGGTTAAAPSVHRTEDGLTAEGVIGEESRGSGCSDRISGGSAPPGDPLSSSTTDGGRGEDELSGPPGVSLHITLRAGSKGEQNLKPGDPQPAAEHSAAVLQNKTPAPPKLSSLSSLEEGQLLKGLRERMGQLSVQETSEEGRGRHHKREEDNMKKERRRKERKASAEGGGEEQTLRTPLMEPGPAPCPPQLRPAEEREHPPLSSRTADCQVCAGETGRGGEEELAPSFVIL
ncbi:spermatogenesis-associated protein 2-like protein [Pseudochaenichthys georgianus]|uniref:spermatogenesis-associated protein 2-like protein n=1 Tax=Pseudochaenichthys georgianus TaxID=52239 RepID=UPI00146F55DC|nr:spermatogenesis-associated protein 2-like protein [Pseudochaenichthys georgianus]